MIRVCFLMIKACFLWLLCDGHIMTGNERLAVEKGIRENLTYPKGSQRNP